MSRLSTPVDPARLLAARSAGTVLVLAILAPVATHALNTATDRAVLQGTALVLDARLPPLEKLDLAPRLLDGVQTERPRAGLKAAVVRSRGEFADQVEPRGVAQREQHLRQLYILQIGMWQLAGGRGRGSGQISSTFLEQWRWMPGCNRSTQLER